MAQEDSSNGRRLHSLVRAHGAAGGGQEKGPFRREAAPCCSFMRLSAIAVYRYTDLMAPQLCGRVGTSPQGFGSHS